MKKLVIPAAIAFLASAPLAFAQDRHDDQHGAPAGHAAPAHAAPKRAPAHAAPAHAMRAAPTHAAHGNAGPAHAAAAQHMMPARPMTHAGPANANRGSGHANYAQYHRNFNAPHRYHASVYHQPPGYYAHRWTFGQILPTAFWARNYWLMDFGDYGLMPPPPGTTWVRYGDDALLIDEYSGEVIQVEYNIFY